MDKRKRITLESLQKSSFFIVYDDLIQDKENKYPKLSIEAKILYFKMRSRYQSSILNNWIDENKIPYIFFSLEEIMDFMSCAKEKAFKLKKSLLSLNFLEEVQIGQGNPNKIYLFEYKN